MRRSGVNLIFRKLTVEFLAVFALVSCSARWSNAAAEPHRESITNSSFSNERVEFFWSKPAGKGPFPMIVFLHGHQGPVGNRIGGRAFVDWGVLENYTQAGFVAVSVSQPGYGGSEGKPDFCGPRTQAVRTLIDHFRTLKFIAPKKIAVQGVSRGAVVAAMVATRDPNLRAVVLISGVYNLKSFYNDQCANGPKTAIADSICRSIRQEMSIDEQEFANRSAINYAKRIKAEVLILHGAEDQNAPAGQAQAFAEALRKAGVTVEFEIFPGVNHQVPLATRQPIINSFLKRALGVAQELPQ